MVDLLSNILVYLIMGIGILILAAPFIRIIFDGIYDRSDLKNFYLKFKNKYFNDTNKISRCKTTKKIVRGARILWTIWFIAIWLIEKFDIFSSLEITSDYVSREGQLWIVVFGFAIAFEKHLDYVILKKKYKKLKKEHL